MIVMKFGGSSVESRKAIERVAGIVYQRRHQNPIVVVSAMGKTTNRLLAIAADAVAGRREAALASLGELREFHLREAKGLPAHDAMKTHFEELGELIKGVAIMGEFTPRASDAVSSYGERLSSLIVADVFTDWGMNARHLDSRTVIVTDRRHTQAAPLFDQTNAKLSHVKWRGVTVMGGFIASTEDGVTTTLGRGGSDYTASIVGAGISAEEIQIWTDVDGMLTTDPRIAADFHRVRSLSYAEAAEMACCGAKVLHPDSVAPAIRQHIPIVIRNSRNPANEGTRIGPGASGSGMVKSIACRQDRMVLEIRPDGAGDFEPDTPALAQICDRHGMSPEWIGRQGNAAFLAVRDGVTPDQVRAPFEGCVQVRIHPKAAVLTLVGDGVARETGVCARARNALKQIPAMILSAAQSDHAIVVVVPQSELTQSAALLHREFFAQPDPSLFAPCHAEA